MHWRKKYNFGRFESKSINIDQWARNKKSLTKRIKKTANLKIELITNNNKNKNLLLSEKFFFPLYSSEAIYLREVIIFANGLPIMYARTTLPRKYLRSYWSNIKKLNDNSLSDVVYEKPSIKRSNFSYLPLSLNNKIYKKINSFGFKNKNLIIGRQSNFEYKKKNILLTEYFFEAINNFEF